MNKSLKLLTLSLVAIILVACQSNDKENEVVKANENNDVETLKQNENEPEEVVEDDAGNEDEISQSEKEELLERMDEEVDRLVYAADGLIDDIKPILGNDWSSVYIHVSDAWFGLDDEEKEYWANELGNVTEANIKHVGVSDSSVIDFVDKHDNVVAKQKMLGGYELK